MTTQAAARNGLGTAALILGIIGLALCWIPVVNYVALVLGAIGLALALGALARLRKGQADNTVTTAIGGVLCVASIVLSFVVFASFAKDVEVGITNDPGPDFSYLCEPPMDC